MVLQLCLPILKKAETFSKIFIIFHLFFHSQARQFAEVANVNGIILTKLDGTAKGGIAVAIQSELDIPVKYIGVGESIDDLQKFDADAFVNALFDVDHKDEPDD